MLKRNLIAIAIVTLGLVMTINTFGQGRTPVSKKDKPKRSDLIKPMQAEVNEVMIDGTTVWGNEVKITGGKNGNSETARTSKSNKQDKLGNFEIQDLKMNPKQVQAGQNSGGTISNQRVSQNSQNKLGNFEIQDIKSPRDVATGQIKSPRDVASGQATGKRQPTQDKLGNFEIQMAKKPTANLGDTGTHEVGHKQRKARKN